VTDEIKPEEVTISPFYIYPPKFFNIDLSGGDDETVLTIKTWGAQFANRPLVLRMPRGQAADLLKRLQKVLDGPV